MEAVKSLYLSFKAVAALEAMRQAIKPICCIYIKHFRILHKTNELQGDEYLGDCAELQVCDLPYNARCQ